MRAPHYPIRPPCAATTPGFLFPARPNSASGRRRRHVRCQGLFDLFTQPARQAVAVEEDEAGGALRSWLEEQGMPPQKVTVANDALGGRGLFAIGPISKGVPAVQVPGHLILTAETAAQQSALSALLPQYPLPAWSVLALWLAEARAAGRGHPWARYVEVLPVQTGCVLEWSDAEVAWLRGSHLYQLAEEIRSAARTSWDEMQPLLRAAAAAATQQGAAARGAFSQEALAWAFAMLLTRLIRLPGLGDAEALVPWADFLNHDCAAETFLDWDPASSAVVLRADRQYRPGEQVFVSYSNQKTGGQLLLSYGFLPEPGSNPHDGCLLPISLISGAGSAAGSGKDIEGWRAEVAEQWGLPLQQAFPLRMGALPAGLLPYAALADAEVGSREAAAALGAQLFGSGGGGGTAAGGFTGGSAALHRTALQAVVRRCQQALKSYAAPLEANKTELGQLQARRVQGGGGPPSRREQVLQVLLAEQQVLSRTVFLLQQQVRQLKKV